MTELATMQLKGAREAAAALRDLRDEIPSARGAIRSALRYAADRMRRVIIAFAPKRTSRLVNALSVKSSTSCGIARARVIVNTAGKRGDPENAFYWRFLERGWHSRRGLPFRKPFIEPAVTTESQDAAQSVVTALEKTVARAAARARS